MIDAETCKHYRVSPRTGKCRCNVLADLNCQYAECSFYAKKEHEVKSDCVFFQDNKTCKALTDIYCKYEECKFYKPVRKGKALHPERYTWWKYVKTSVTTNESQFFSLDIEGDLLTVAVDAYGKVWLRVFDFTKILDSHCNEFAKRHAPVMAIKIMHPPQARGQRSIMLRSDALETTFEKSVKADRVMLARLIRMFQKVKA